MRNVLLKIAYDGSRFHGWQRQPNLRTVQGQLEEALSTLTGMDISLDGTSRTDAGVHALGQCATMRGTFGIPVEKIPIAANNLLTDIMILSAEEKPDGFHARYNAAGKTYLYRYAIDPEVTVFLQDYVCLLAKKPNIVNMEEAAKYIEGTHDFACFQAAGSAILENTVRTVYKINICTKEKMDSAGNRYEAVEIEATGDGFLYNMVRIISGTLTKVGFGKMMPKDIEKIIASKDRTLAGQTAPPQGLYLKEVFFDKEMIERKKGEF
jgi:pseudouridylate synthase I